MRFSVRVLGRGIPGSADLSNGSSALRKGPCPQKSVGINGLVALANPARQLSACFMFALGFVCSPLWLSQLLVPRLVLSRGRFH